MDTHCEIADQMEISFKVSYDERNTMIVAADRPHNACPRVAMTKPRLPTPTQISGERPRRRFCDKPLSPDTRHSNY